MVRMYLSRLTLENFRNLTSVHLDLRRGRTVLFGENAQGKSNVLEAVYMFAVSRSARSAHERDIVAWDALASEIPYTRLHGAFERRAATFEVDIVVQLSRGPDAAADPETLPHQKRIKVNGVPRRAGNLVGEVLAVLFEPQDIELVYGSPSERRRHLDLTLSQIDSKLLQELQRYNRVVSQRNSLLKAIREGESSRDELAYWDGELVEAGSYITLVRLQALEELDRLAREVHRELTGGSERLELSYEPSIRDIAAPGEAAVEEAFRRRLALRAEPEILAGATLVGPHRDDFVFQVDGRNLAEFGSRGQQRLATLALKLAEARLMRQRAGEEPILLLDDVLSELDPARRGYLMSEIGAYGQAILTTADLGALEPGFVDGSNVLKVVQGRVEAPVQAE